MTTPRAVRRWRRRLGGRTLLAVLGASALVLGAFSMVLAVHDEQFQLDRNTAAGAPPASLPSTVYDWESLFNDPNVPATGSGNRPTETIPAGSGFSDIEFVEDWSFVNGAYVTNDPTTFTQSKDIENIGTTDGWRCKAANQVTNKGDITNAYVGVYEKNGKKILYFGLEKDQDSGSNNVGLWILQDGSIGCAGGGSGNGNAFSGLHTPGDIFLVSEFTNGGGVSAIKGYKWVPDLDPSKAGNQPGVDPQPFAASADCVVSPGGPAFDDRLCATSNTTQFSPQWTHWNFDNGLNNGLKPATFIEGGISIGEFPEFANACFNKFLFNTRSSPELTATLYDYSLGNIGTCDGNISISPSGVNEVGSGHTFTVTATSLSSAVPTAIAITPNVTPAPGSQSTTCGSPTLSNGGKTATCTVTINSTTAGTFTANATVVFTYSGGTTVTRDTNPATTSIPAGSGGSGPAVKQYVDASITIGANDVNEVGDGHTFTITVTAIPSGATPVTFGTITPSVSPAPSSSSNTCASPTINGNVATCTLTINSTTAGTFTANASASVTMGGVTVTRDTDPATSSVGSGPNGSGPAVKTYVSGTLRWLKHDGNGVLLPGATFQVCRTLDRAGGAVTGECVTVADNTAPDTDPTGGEFQLNGLILGTWTITETIAPTGYHKDDTVATVVLTLTNPSNADGDPTDAVPVFVNVRAFRLIVLTCDDISHTLVRSTVDLDGSSATSGDTQDTIAVLPQYLINLGVADADICGSTGNPDGIGGASYGNLDEGIYQPKVIIPKPS